MDSVNRLDSSGKTFEKSITRLGCVFLLVSWRLEASITFYCFIAKNSLTGFEISFAVVVVISPQLLASGCSFFVTDTSHSFSPKCFVLDPVLVEVSSNSVGTVGTGVSEDTVVGSWEEIPGRYCVWLSICRLGYRVLLIALRLEVSFVLCCIITERSPTGFINSITARGSNRGSNSIHRGVTWGS